MSWFATIWLALKTMMIPIVSTTMVVRNNTKSGDFLKRTKFDNLLMEIIAGLCFPCDIQDYFFK